MTLRTRLLALALSLFLTAGMTPFSLAVGAEVAPTVEVTGAILRNAIYAGAIPGHPLSGRYECTADSDSSVLALRYKGPEVGDNTSNLVGYYKVALSNGAISEWDLGQSRAGKLIFRPKAKPGAAK